jgi:uncharacterized protein (DUF2237 family)
LGVALLAACAGTTQPSPRAAAAAAPARVAATTTNGDTISEDGEQGTDCAAPGSCALPPTPATTPAVAEREAATNLDGAPLSVCSEAPRTGFYRDGRCATGPDDRGVHVVCAQVTQGFLDFARAHGNDLVTPRGSSFPGLRAGDRWCLCAMRWEEARRGGVAPPIVRAATERRALDFSPREALLAHALPDAATSR